jgi:hypothetical protein
MTSVDSRGFTKVVNSLQEEGGSWEMGAMDET